MTITNTGEIVTVENSSSQPTPNYPGDLVTSRFDNTLAMANNLLTLLVGSDGESGYLGALNSAIAAAPSVPITYTPVDTAVTLISDATPRPVFDRDDLIDFTFTDYAEPGLEALPAIDVSSLIPSNAPDDINPVISWVQNSLPTDVYTDLLARITADLQSGATGLSPAVEQAIYDRAKARQVISNDAAYQKLNNDIASRRFNLSPGVMDGALAEFYGEIERQDTEIDNNIITTQAELAQKNSQFSIQQAVAMEDLVRRTKDNKDKNDFEYAKAVAELVVQVYAEKIKAYVAEMEANKIYVEVQVERLKAVIESNKSLVELFKEKYEAQKTRVEAVSSYNKSVTDTYSAEVQGYGESVRADSAINTVTMEHLKVKMMAAEMELRQSIQEATNTLQGYVSENQLKEKVAGDLSTITSQAVVGTLNAVSATASIGYNGSETKSEHWSSSVSLSENHGYEHDPEA